MQYEITLPADYDMAIINKRVADRGHLMDGFAGLGFKAYLVRTTPVNQYAPFYVWTDTVGMNRFLWGGGGFTGVVDSFGRPAVNHWTGVALRRGPDTEVRAATRVRAPIPAEVELTSYVEGQVAALRRVGYASVLGIDPYRWELVRFTLWDAIPADEPGDRYQVPHLSTSGELADYGFHTPEAAVVVT
jgi:hypothetical protein